jgi:hypothetical protein
MSDLRSTVESHPNIFEVHFDAQGQHYFNAREHDNVKFGQFLNGLPILSSRITETKTREEVLGKSRSFDTQDKNDYVTETVEKRRKR